MSADNASTTTNPAGPLGKLGRIAEEIGEGAAGATIWEISRRPLASLARKIWERVSGAITDAPKDATIDIITERIKKTFLHIRAELRTFINHDVRAESEEGLDSADNILECIALRERCAPKPYTVHRGEPRNYKPLDEVRALAALTALYEYLEEAKEETARVDEFVRIGQTKTRSFAEMAEAFDQMVESLTHNVLKQTWEWVAETTLPIRTKIAWLWNLADAKLRTFVTLFVGEPIWLILAFMVLGFFLYGKPGPAKGLLGVLSVLSVVAAGGWAVWRNLDAKRARRLQAELDEDEFERPVKPPETKSLWRRAFGWGSLTLIPLIFAIGLYRSASAADLPYLVSWIIGGAFAIAVSYLIFGRHPIYAVGAAYLGEIPKYGKPLRRILKDFAGLIALLCAFPIFFPFGHMEQHPLLSILLILLILGFFWSFYAEIRFLQVALAAIMAAVFIYGFVMNPVERKRFAPAVSAVSELFATQPAKAATPPAPTAPPAPVSTKPPATSKHHAEQPVVELTKEEPIFSVGQTASANHETRRESSVATIVGEVVPCEAGDVPQNHMYKGALCLDNGREVIRLQYNWNTPVYWHGTQYRAGNLEPGDEVSAMANGYNLRSAQVLGNVRESRNNWR